MDNFKEIHESPAIAHAGDNISQAGAAMSTPANQLMFREATASAGNTAHNFLPSLSLELAQAAEQADPSKGKLDLSPLTFLFEQQRGGIRKYDGGSFGIGLGEEELE